MASRSVCRIDDILSTKEAGSGKLHYDPYKSLAAAICLQAFDDLKYRYEILGNEVSNSTYRRDCISDIDSLVDFFRSDWYQFLSGHDDGERAIEMAKFRGEYNRFRRLHNCSECVCTACECVHRTGSNWDKIDSSDIFCPETYKTKTKKRRKRVS